MQTRNASLSYYSPSKLNVEVESFLIKQVGKEIIKPFTYTYFEQPQNKPRNKCFGSQLSRVG